MTSQPGKNFPEPRTAADRIALKAAELLDEDVYGPITSTHVTIRGARFYLGSYSAPIHLETGFEGDGGHFNRAGLTAGIEQVFRQAWKAAVERRKAILLAPLQESITDETYEAKQEAEKARYVERSQALVHRRDLGGWGRLFRFDRPGHPVEHLCSLRRGAGQCLRFQQGGFPGRPSVGVSKGVLPR